LRLHPSKYTASLFLGIGPLNKKGLRLNNV